MTIELDERQPDGTEVLPSRDTAVTPLFPRVSGGAMYGWDWAWPLSNCFYGGAFPQCLASFCKVQGVRGLSPKARERPRPLCVSFECDSLNEELKEGRVGVLGFIFYVELGGSCDD